AALLGLVARAGPSAGASRIGVGKMTVTPDRVVAGSTGNELTLTFTADAGALVGETIVDVPRGWTAPQRRSSTAPGFVELKQGACARSTRITAVAYRPITVTPSCAWR